MKATRKQRIRTNADAFREADERAAQMREGKTPPPIAATADPEYATRIDADRATLQFKQKLERTLGDLSETPLFGGPKQGALGE